MKQFAFNCYKYNKLSSVGSLWFMNYPGKTQFRLRFRSLIMSSTTTAPSVFSSTEHHVPFVSIKPNFAQILWGFYRNEKNGLYIYHQIDLMSTIYCLHQLRKKLLDLRRQTNISATSGFQFSLSVSPAMNLDFLHQP